MALAQSVLGNSFIRRIVGDAGKVFTLKALAAALNYATIIVLAHWLDPTAYGHYGSVMSAVAFGAVLCGLGGNLSVIRFLGEYRAKNRPDQAWGAVRYSERIVLTTTLACAGLVSAVALAGRFEEAWVYAVAAFLILPAFTLMEIQNGILRSYDAIAWALVPKDFGWRITLILASFAIYTGMAPGERLFPVILASGIGITVFALVQRAYLRACVARMEPVDKVTTDVLAWKRTSLTIWVTQIARSALGTLDVLIVGALLSIETAAVYFVVVRTAEVIIFLTACLNLAIGPLIARHYAEGMMKKVQQVLGVAAVLMTALTLGAFLVCVVGGQLVLGIFGAGFAKGHLALILLTSGHLVSAVLGTGDTLVMTGHERVNAKLLLLMSPLTLVGVVVLTPIYGLEGAAFASGLGIAVWSILVWVTVRRLTPFDPSVFHAAWMLWTRFRQTPARG